MKYVSPDSEKNGIEWASTLQQGSCKPLMSVLAAFDSVHGLDELRSKFSVELSSAREGVLAPFERAWAAILSNKPVLDLDADIISSDTLAYAQIYFRFVLSPPVQFRVRGGAAAEIDKMMDAGFLPATLIDFLDVFLRADPRWEEILSTSRMAGEIARRRVVDKEAECGWVDRTLAAGCLTFIDPRTGHSCIAMDSIMAFGRCLYRFEGKEPFFLLTGGPWNAPPGIYFPQSGYVISFGGEWSSRLRGEMLANILSVYLKRPVRPQLRRHGSPEAMTLLIPPVDNFAHHIWNYLSGIERAHRLGTIDRVAVVQFAGTEFFGPVEDLFPELANGRLVRLAREPVVDPAPLEANSLVLPAAGFFIPRTLTDRIIQVLGDRPRGRVDAVEPKDIPRVTGAPVIWFGLRVRGRAWVSQVPGFAHIMWRVSERYPDAIFLLDGFSYPVGLDQVSVITHPRAVQRFGIWRRLMRLARPPIAAR